MTNTPNVVAKMRADYICSRCGSTERIQAHHQVRKDDSSLVVLCAECHSLEHPDVPRGLFLSSNRSHQPYWPNVSARSLASDFGCCSRTIIRRAKSLGILPLSDLTQDNRNRLQEVVFGRANLAVGILPLGVIHTFTLRIPKEAKDRLQEIAQSKGLSFSAYIRMLLIEQAKSKKV